MQFVFEDFSCGQENNLIFLAKLDSLGESKAPQSRFVFVFFFLFFFYGKRKQLREGPRWLPPDRTLGSSEKVCFNCFTLISSKEQFGELQVGICKRLKETENCYPAVILCLCLFYVSK